MAASLDGFIARKDGSTDWLDPADEFARGEVLDAANVEFHSGDLKQLVEDRLRPRFRGIWFVGGGKVSGQCLSLGLADEVRYSIVPILIGDGLRFFERLDTEVALHLTEVKGYKSGMVGLAYEVRRS